MITPSFSLTATERVLPKLALDFTTASLDSRVTFTRTGNTATVTNSSGYVVPINANLPRFDYDPIALTCKGLLIEESRTNNLLYGSDLTQATWTKNSATVAANAATGPDNTTSASSYIPDNGATVECTLASVIIITADKDFTISGFFKKIGNAAGVALYSTASNNGFRIGLNFSTGLISLNQSVGTGVLRAYGVQAYPNGWYRIWASGRLGVGGVNGQFRFRLADAFGANTAGNGTDGMYFYGGQFENSTVDISFVTSYIPTVAASVTRNADVAVMTSTNFSSWYTATTGAAVVWAIPQAITGTRPLIQFDDTTANEIIALRGNVADPELYIVDGGAPQAQIDAGTIVANTAYKLTGAWNTDSCAAAQNGAAAVTDNTATIPTPTQLRIGSDGTNYASALIQKVLYYPQRIINAEVQAFSK
jgi:hypothetical protein